MKKLWQLLALLCMAFAVPATVLAQSLGLNFVATDAGNFDAAQPSALDPTDVAGVVGQSNWNNLDLATGSAPPPTLVYDDGVGGAVNSTASVTWGSPNTWFAAGQNMFPAGSGNRKLMMGYLDSNDTAAGGVMITVNNIDAALRTPSYDVVVYLSTDSTARRGGAYTIDDGTGPETKFGSTLGGLPTLVEDPGTDADNSLTGNYLTFPGLTGSSFTLTSDTTLTTPNGFRAPVAGLQIVKHLIPGDVDGDGQVNLTDFHIIRANLFESGRRRAQGDLVGGDGIVDFADYREWKEHAPAALAASASLSIPEPNSAALFALAAALAGFARQRRRK